MIMKKTLLILSALVLIFAEHEAQAQIINPGFETWSADLAVPSAMNPNSGNNTFGWCDYNFFNSSLVGSSPLSVFRCDTAHSGTYSCRIKTAIYSQTSYPSLKAGVIRGMLLLGFSSDLTFFNRTTVIHHWYSS
jgi:hypothetical protein